MNTKATTKQILLIEDDATLSRLIVDQLERLGYATVTAPRWSVAQAKLEESEPRLAILDIRLPDADGLEVLPGLAEHCPVVVLTAYGSIDNAVRAMKAGATEYLIKPVGAEALEFAVSRALETESLRRDNEFWKRRFEADSGTRMIGDSPGFADVRKLIGIVAPTDTTVLIEGESGVGKELVAQTIHEQSMRATTKFVAIDCCTLQENLFESELFGHERGAFTGADRRKQGLIEVAEGGTVFLDEIGETTAAIQAKLLRVLETGHFRRLGGNKDLTGDVRFVAATNRSLEEMAAAGEFRADLYYRLSAFVVLVPPLRERRADIPALAEHFLQARHFSTRRKKHFKKRALAALSDYAWPGNIRELRNIVERAALVSGDDAEVGPEHLALPPGTTASLHRTNLSFEGEPTLEELRRTYLEALLNKYDGRRARVAEVLGISERNLYRLLRKNVDT